MDGWILLLLAVVGAVPSGFDICKIYPTLFYTLPVSEPTNVTWQAIVPPAAVDTSADSVS